MDADHGLIRVGMARLRILMILVFLVLLISCSASDPIIQESPIPSPNTSVSTAQTISTLEPILTDPPIPTILEPTATNAPPQITPDGIETVIYTPSINIPARYTLDAIFNYYQHTLSVTETISYVNYTPDDLPDLVLMVEPNRWQGGFSLVSLTWENGEVIDQYELQDDHMHLSLPTPLAPGDGLKLIFRYRLELPEIPPPSDTLRPQPFGYTERQTNIVDWYPYIPPYRTGVGWLVHTHTWFGEHQVFDVAEFHLSLTLDEPVQDLVIAASAPAVREGDTYSYYLQAARTIALSASDRYLVQSTNVGDVTIYSYTFPYDKYAGQEVLHNTADSLQLFSQLIMPYPLTSLSVVEADFLDGMEYDGLYFLSHGFYDLYDGSPKGYLTFIAAHETAHQWWYGLVGNDQALEPWLDEAMSTYMEHVFYENVYADYLPDSGQRMVDWWWYYRVNFYDPVGWVDGTIYDFNWFYDYRDGVYLNGAKFFEDLRNMIGDQDFFAFIRDYAQRNRYKIATASDFFAILREHTSVDLDGLLAEYFQSAH